MNLYDQVMHALEGNEEISDDQYIGGEIKRLTHKSFGPDKWIDRASSGKIDAINLLAIIVFVLEDFRDENTESRSIVEAWAEELCSAAKSGEITARSKATLLSLKSPPKDFDWLVFPSDADKFLQARGMKWTSGEVLEHLRKECKRDGVKYYDESGAHVMTLWDEGFGPAVAHKSNQPAHPTQGKTTSSEETAPGANDLQAGENQRPVPRQTFQEQAILRAIRDLLHDPKALPKVPPGTPGPKAQVMRSLNFSVSVFNKAWERLRASGQIADAK